MTAIIERMERVTLVTAEREFVVSGTAAQPYTIHERIQDWVTMGVEQGELIGISRSTITHRDEGGEWQSAIFRVTCPCCGRRFIDVSWYDPCDVTTTCDHCGQMVEY